jgi:hypothetical protein
MQSPPSNLSWFDPSIAHTQTKKTPASAGVFLVYQLGPAT